MLNNAQLGSKIVFLKGVVFEFIHALAGTKN